MSELVGNAFCYEWIFGLRKLFKCGVDVVADRAIDNIVLN